jgi:hypothetical protein
MNGGQCYRPGDWVVYRKHKHSASPGPRAKYVAPEPKGEEYSYCVDKFWVVMTVEGTRVVLATRRGKHHVVDAQDLNLRQARWWERLLFRDRFPHSHNMAAARTA